MCDTWQICDVFVCIMCCLSGEIKYIYTSMYHHVAVSGWRTGGTLWGRCRLVRHQSHDDSRRAGRDRRPTEQKTGEGAGTQLASTPLWLLCWRQPQPKQTTIPVSNIQPTNHASSHKVCHPTEVTFPPSAEPKMVLDYAIPEGCKAELT